MKVNDDSGDGVVSVNLTHGQVQQKLETSLTHVTTWWGWLEEDEMEKTWNQTESMEGATISRCTVADIVVGKRHARSWLRWMHLDFIGCTTHYGILTIEFLAENHPKNIYSMS